MRRAFRRGAQAAVLIALVVSASASADSRDVLYVGNNWDGTADVVDPVSFRRLTRLEHRPRPRRARAEIAPTPRRWLLPRIRQLVGEGHDQFVDDMFSSPDGRFLYVSRPSFADVVAIDLRTGRSSGASRSTATGPTTWRSPPTAGGCRVGLDRASST